MKLHVFPPSPSARKVMIGNVEMGLNLPLEMVNLQTGAQKSPAFLKLNPNGKIPVLEWDDGSTLTESNVILNRMATEAKSDLWPRSNLRYDILRWQFWEACHWTPTCGKFIARHLLGNEDIDLDAAAVDFARYAQVLDDHLAGRDWLVGAGMTTADISVAAILCYRGPCQYPMAGYDNIARWIGTIAATEGWQSVDRAMQAP